MLLLYIATRGSADVLDEQCRTCGLLQRKMVGEASLLQFVKQNNLSGYGMIAFDLMALKDSETELRNAVYSVQLMYPHIRLVAIALDDDRDTATLRMLAQLGVSNIVLQQSDILLCLSLEGMLEPDMKALDKPLAEAIPQAETPPTAITAENAEAEPVQEIELVLPPTPTAPQTELLRRDSGQTVTLTDHLPSTVESLSHEPIEPEPVTAIKAEPTNPVTQEPISQLMSVSQPPIRQRKKALRPISIGVCGLIHRAGTTTQAFGIAGYLAEQGYTACYIEVNHHGHIAWLSRYYDVEVEEQGVMHCSGVSIIGEGNTIPQNQEYLVYDFRLLEETPPHEFIACDIKVLCSGAKPWELSWLGELFRSEKPNFLSKLHYIFSFVDSDEQEYARSIMGQFAGKTYFADYAPSLFLWQANEGIYHIILHQ